MSKDKSLGSKTVKGTLWAAVDRFGNTALMFIVNIVMAHLLTPEDFGIIGVLTIFITVSQVLVDGGFGSALIQKKDPTQKDYSTVFWWNLILSIVLYLLLYILAPFIADFFRMPNLKDVLRCIGLTIPISSLSIIQNNRLRKQLEFTKVAISNISSALFGGVIGILLAIKGFGVWSLVGMQIASRLFIVFILWPLTKWSPSIFFSTQILKKLFSYGGYLLASSVLQDICKNFQGILIGKFFNTTQMGYYSQAYKLENVASTSVSGVMVQVMFPVYASIQHDIQKMTDVIQKSIRVISFIVFPLMGLLILGGEQLICLLFGDQWKPAVPYFQILCVGGIFSCMQNINFYAVAAKGKSKSLFYWSFYKWISVIVFLLIGLLGGMVGIMWAKVIGTINIWFVNVYLTQKHLGVSILSQIKAFLPILLISSSVFLISYILDHIFFLNKYIIYIFFILGIIILSYLLRLKAFSDLKEILYRFRA